MYFQFAFTWESLAALGADANFFTSHHYHVLPLDFAGEITVENLLEPNEACKKISQFLLLKGAQLFLPVWRKIHERTHTGEKPFSCSHCDYKCSRSSQLKIHLRTHTGDKPFSCSLCDYICSNPGNLKTHKRIHTDGKPFSCTHCDYKCKTSGQLKTHDRIHTGDKPFSCSQCDYKCTTSGSLKTHVFIFQSCLF